MWYSWLHSCPVEYGALLRSHSKRSIGHSGSICFLMKSTRSLIRLCCDVQVRPYRISFFWKMVEDQCLVSTWTASLSTQAKTAEWDEILSSSQAFCRQEFMVAGVKSGRSTAGPRVASWGKVLPLRGGYNHTVHRTCVGAAAAWCYATYSTWLKGRAAWHLEENKEGIWKCAVIHQASQSRDFSQSRDQSVVTNKVPLCWFQHLKCIVWNVFCFKLVCS